MTTKLTLNLFLAVLPILGQQQAIDNTTTKTPICINKAVRGSGMAVCGNSAGFTKINADRHENRRVTETTSVADASTFVANSAVAPSSGPSPVVVLLSHNASGCVDVYLSSVVGEGIPYDDSVLAATTLYPSGAEDPYVYLSFDPQIANGPGDRWGVHNVNIKTECSPGRANGQVLTYYTKYFPTSGGMLTSTSNVDSKGNFVVDTMKATVSTTGTLKVTGMVFAGENSATRVWIDMEQRTDFSLGGMLLADEFTLNNVRTGALVHIQTPDGIIRVFEKIPPPQ
jgi:hypothetical protein